MRLNNWSIAASYETARNFARLGFGSSTASRSIIARPRRTGLKRLGAGTVSTMKVVADNVQGVIIPGSGHWVEEEAPEKLLAALASFLAPYRDGLFVAQ
jgi:hypothetical protein